MKLTQFNYFFAFSKFYKLSFNIDSASQISFQYFSFPSRTDFFRIDFYPIDTPTLMDFKRMRINSSGLRLRSTFTSTFCIFLISSDCHINSVKKLPRLINPGPISFSLVHYVHSWLCFQILSFIELRFYSLGENYFSFSLRKSKKCFSLCFTIFWKFSLNSFVAFSIMLCLTFCGSNQPRRFSQC